MHRHFSCHIFILPLNACSRCMFLFTLLVHPHHLQSCLLNLHCRKFAPLNSTERQSSSKFGTQLGKNASAPSPPHTTEELMVSLSSTMSRTMSPSTMSSNGCTKSTGMPAKMSTSSSWVTSAILKESVSFPLNRVKNSQMDWALSFWRHPPRPLRMLNRLS